MDQETLLHAIIPLAIRDLLSLRGELPRGLNSFLKLSSAKLRMGFLGGLTSQLTYRRPSEGTLKLESYARERERIVVLN